MADIIDKTDYFQAMQTERLLRIAGEVIRSDAQKAALQEHIARVERIIADSYKLTDFYLPEACDND